MGKEYLPTGHSGLPGRIPPLCPVLMKTYLPLPPMPSKRRKEDLLSELEVVQKSSALLFGSFDEEQLEASGEANNNSIYVAGIGFAIVGHTLHHMNIIKERYL